MKRSYPPLIQVLMQCGLSEKRARIVLGQLADRIIDEVRVGKPVRWPGLGVFHLSGSKPRRVMNPATREHMMLPGTKRIRFRTSKLVRVTL